MSQISRRDASVQLLALAGSTLAISSPARAQSSYPNRLIKLIVPYPAGGASDTQARVLADGLGKELGQAVVVENRGGGGSIIGTQAAAASKPDGYTILQIQTTSVIIPFLQDVTFDLERDFKQIIGVGWWPAALSVASQSKIETFADFVKLTKSTPEGMNYGSGGVGSVSHLAVVRLLKELNIQAVHVPYRGNSGAVLALMSEQVQFLFTNASDVIPSARSGAVRVLAVTSDKRLPSLPNAPTMKELGFPDFTPRIWFGYCAPANTPDAIIQRLYAALGKVMLQPEAQRVLGNLDFTTDITDPVAFGAYVKEDSARWGSLIREQNIKI